MRAVGTLLEEKQLYQRVEVDVADIEQAIGTGESPADLHAVMSPTVPTIPQEEYTRRKREWLSKDGDHDIRKLYGQGRNSCRIDAKNQRDESV